MGFDVEDKLWSRCDGIEWVMKWSGDFERRRSREYFDADGLGARLGVTTDMIRCVLSPMEMMPAPAPGDCGDQEQTARDLPALLPG